MKYWSMFLYSFINVWDWKLYDNVFRFEYYLSEILFIYTDSSYGVRLKTLIYRTGPGKKMHNDHLFDKNINHRNMNGTLMI